MLTVDEWRTLNTSTQICDVDIHMPRFVIEDHLDLVDILEGMDIHDAFSSTEADFSAISPAALHVSKVYQKARIEVDEAGTAAAALTVIDSDSTGMPDPDKVPPLVTLNFDRPFYFTIEDREDDSVLFMGHHRREPAHEQDGAGRRRHRPRHSPRLSPHLRPQRTRPQQRSPLLLYI